MCSYKSFTIKKHDWDSFLLAALYIFLNKRVGAWRSPGGLAERHKAAVAAFIPSGDRVLMIIARTMPCMCQTIGK